MSLNYDLQFTVYEEDGLSIVPNAKIHAYFNKVNSSSSSSKYNETIKITNAIGKTSLNCGDFSFLTSNGKIDNGDIILVVAWLTDNTSQTDDKSSKVASKITRCVNFIHVVNTSKSSWIENFILPEVKASTCNITWPSVANTGHLFTVNNSSNIQEGPYSYNTSKVVRSDLYQNITKYGQNLFLGRGIKETEYNFIEYSSTKSLITPISYTFIDAGLYSCYARVYNHLGVYCESQKTYTIKYNKPTIAFDFSFTKLLNTDKHTGVGNDDLLYTVNSSSPNYNDTFIKIQASFDWLIEDLNQNLSNNNTIELNKDKSFILNKLFNTSGAKNLKLTLNWNDGFDWKKEELTKNPVLDVYSLNIDFSWISVKNYIVLSKYVPIGDDDRTTISNLSLDNSTQNYNSTSQWNTVSYNIIKKKNDGSDDNELFSYIKPSNLFNEKPQFFIKYHHSDMNPCVITQEVNYWDGFKNIMKTLTKNIITEKYSINQDFTWNTLYYGLNKVATSDSDEVTVSNTSIIQPQNNKDIVLKDYYFVTKNKFTSYLDSTVLVDNEEFTYQNNKLNNFFSFYIRKNGTNNIFNEITFYNGYQEEVISLTKDILSKELTPVLNFTWASRKGFGFYVEGRDDNVEFSQTSHVVDFYGKHYPVVDSRHLSVDWSFRNDITANNFDTISTIGGTRFGLSLSNSNTFDNKDVSFKPKINYLSEKVSQDCSLVFHYNNGYFNLNNSITKQIETRAYTSLIIGANYTHVVPDRNTNVTFSCASTNNYTRIIDEDWTLSDRYSVNSMNTNLRGGDNLQSFIKKARIEIITTKVNSNENHALGQLVRWDNGFKEVQFNALYSISTTNYSINPDFDYKNKYKTGPDIQFWNTSTNNGAAVQLKYNLELKDKENSGLDAFKSYNNILIGTIQEHKYKSTSNSPFEPNINNKEVRIIVNYDDGWDEIQSDYSALINVRPNNISQSFLLNPIRNIHDTGINKSIIVGNNPIEFNDTSSTTRIDNSNQLDYSFIKHVEYKIIETC